MKFKKQQVRIKLKNSNLSKYDFEGNIQDTIKTLEDIYKQNIGEYLQLDLALESIPYEDSYEYNLYGIRLETNEEAKNRYKRSKEGRIKVKEEIEKREKATLEILKKKYDE